MEILTAAQLLAVLGHESRLAAFHRLIEAGPEGMSAGILGKQLNMPAATLSFHLSQLQHVGLIQGRRAGRFIFYSANFTLMDTLLTFLTHNCCQGNPCLPKTTSLLNPTLEQP